VLNKCKYDFITSNTKFRETQTTCTSMNLKPLLLFALIGSSPILNAQTHDYAEAQHLSTYFLGAQRCGDTKSWIHGACHLTDGQAVSKDLTGGWHDCGDYIKFHHTAPYAALMFLYAYENFHEAYADNYSPDHSAGSPNGIPDILDEVKIETDYLIKCVQNGTAYWQVGGTEDHNSFSEPVSNSEEKLYGGSKIRPVESTTSGHSNALGNAASALALMAIIYQQYDATYASTCEQKAIEYYNIAKTNAASTADPDGFYSWLSGAQYHDELGLAAALLKRLTGTASYQTQAISYASGYTGKWDNFDYGNVGPLMYLELYKLTNTATYLNHVKDIVTGYSTASCGYIHLTNWGSLREAGCAAMLAALYHKISNTTSAYTFAKKNVDYILGSHGANGNIPANFSFLIGYNRMGGGYPQHPHHAPAFGYTSTNAWTKYTQEDNTPGSVTFNAKNQLTNQPTKLLGGLAGGPEASCKNFYDDIGNYVSSEYCTYYGAGFTGAVAYINLIENNLTTNVQEYDIFSGVSLYPNPANSGYVNIDIMGSKDILISNQLGQILITQHIERTGMINVSSLPAGIYMVGSTDKKINTKLVIQ